jgi:ABC-type glycerol-3-phosphate transport system substrate-binding protein
MTNVKTGRLSRRSLGALALAVAVSLPGFAWAQQIELSILGSASFSPQNTLPEVAAIYQEVWDKFQADNPDIKLVLEQHSGSTEALQDILTRGTAGRLPDMGVMDTFWVPRLHASQYLQPLDDVLTTEDKADFLPGVLEATTHDGALRAIYIYNPWRGLFYRPSVLKDLGVDTPPTDWNAFIEFGKKAKEKAPNAVMLPANMSELTMQYLYTQYLGLGGELTDDKGVPSFFEPGNREKLEQVYGMWRQLVEEGLMPAEVGTMDEAATRPYFYTGETVLLGASTSSIRQMYVDNPSIKGDLGASPMPLTDGATPVPLLAAWSYVIFTKDAAHAEAASRFIRYMLSPEVLGRLNAAQGHLPMRKSIWATNADFAADPLMQRLYGIMNDPRLRERSIFPIYPAIKDAITGQMADVLAGTTTPAQAVDNAKATAMEAYDRMKG